VDFSLICDVNTQFEHPLYRLNDDKLLKWLRSKVEIILTELTKETTNQDTILGSATSSNYTSIKRKIQNDEYVESAVGFIGEYIDDDLKQKLTGSYAKKKPRLLVLDAYQLNSNSLSLATTSNKKNSPKGSPVSKNTSPKSKKIGRSSKQKKKDNKIFLHFL